MCQINRTSRNGVGALVGVVLLLAGCQQLQVPAFDPTGAQVFSNSDSMRLARLSDSRSQGSCFCPKPAWEQPLSPAPCPEPPPCPPPGAKVPTAPPATAPRRPPSRGVPGKILLTPTRMIAPVGSEVVIVSGMCGEDGYLITQQPIEFMLSQDSVGQFVEISDRDRLWYRSKKLSADYAIARTSTRSQVVTRGTPSVTDDVVQEKGQCWVSLTSASQGTSYVTAVASKGATWPQRRQAATIYWVDAQWAFPDPVAVPAGQVHTLSTSVKRTATGAPVTGFIVRYELVDGTPAVFGPGGATAIEVPTDQDGLANIALQPTTSNPGISQIRIQVIKPADPNSDAPRTQLGEGYTSITWSAPGLALRATGPPTGAVDATLVYRLEVHNPGDLATHDVEVRDVLPPSLKYISSNPPAQVFGNQAVWRLAEIPPKGVQVIEVNLRADGAGAVRYVFQASTGGGMRAEAHVDTQITRPALSLRADGPKTAVVGDRVEFRIEVSNNGDQALDNVTISDRFDASLRHADGLPSPIQKSLGRLEPGQTKVFAVTFLVQRSGQVCHVLEVAAPGGQYAQSQVCLAVSEPEVPSQPRLQVTKTVTPQGQVGQNVQFTTQVTNTGNVPLTNVRIVDIYDHQLQRKEATSGWDSAAWATGELLWSYDRLEPGQSVKLDVLCQCLAPAEAATGRVTVTATENISEVAQASVRISPAPQLQPGTPPGPSTGTPPAAGRLLVEILELSDPVAIGASTTYVIKVKNARPVPDQDIVLNMQFPPGLQFQSVLGLGGGRKVSPDGRTVRINPILEMRANETLPSFRVQAIGKTAGDHTFQVKVTSRLSPQGVVAEEVTTVTSQ